MTLRSDRAVLRSPVSLGDGSVRVEAITSRAGVPLRYPGGRVEVATVEALSDPEYHDALRGLGVVLQSRHDAKVQSGDGARVGTITGARYDESEGAVIQEWVIDHPETASAVLSGALTECSECYEVPVEHEAVRDDGVIEQRKRIPNHTAIVRAGRAAGTTIRRDEADTMTEDEVKALMAPLMERIAALEAAEKADAEEEPEPEPEPEPVRADSASSIIALARKAAELGVDLPDGLETRAAIASHIALALGGDKLRADSLDYCEGVIAASKPVGQKAEWLRSDAASASVSPFDAPTH